MKRLAALLVALAALEGVTPVWATPADLAAARAAVERQDYASALPLFAALVDADGANVDLLIEAARVNGYADRNLDAARLYAQALAQAPARRADILPSLAWQTLWSGDAERAAPMFDELALDASVTRRADALDGLAQSRQQRGDTSGALQAWRAAAALQPDDTRFMLRIARVLMWSDHPDAAVALLEPLARLHPDDREIHWTLANALNFAGLHRAALTEFAAQDAPTRDGERLDVARAWRWAGYDERALPLLADQTDADVTWLRDFRVGREVRRYASARFDSATDRDGLDVRAFTAAYGWRPAPGASAEISARQLSLKDANGNPSGLQLVGLLRWRVGEPGNGYGTLWPSVLLRIADHDGWSPLTGTARLAWIPRDRWRIDAERGREAIETPLAIANRVTVDSTSFGVDYRPLARASVAGAIAALRFDDGNLRWRLSGRTDWLLAPNPRWTVGLEGQTFTSSDPTDATRPGRGYWNPRRYGELRVFSAVSVERRPWDLQARVGIGRARETDGDGNVSTGSPHLWEIGVGYDVSAGLRLGLGVGGSGSGFGITDGATGYWRRTFNLSVTGWF